MAIGEMRSRLAFYRGCGVLLEHQIDWSNSNHAGSTDSNGLEKILALEVGVEGCSTQTWDPDKVIVETSR